MTPKPPRFSAARLPRVLRDGWPVAPALAVFGILAAHLNMIQDDAYITYRYVANYLDGNGLVYNIGERVEGFTNFGWTVVLLLGGVLGGDYIALSRILGVLCGAAVIVLGYLLALELFGRQAIWPAAAVAFLVGINQSLAYWAPAGLETAAFALACVWSLYLFLRRSWLLIAALTLAVWIRPEGAIVTAALVVAEIVQRRRWPRFTIWCALIAFVLSLPMVVFKVSYYGSILPNPFFAKTSFDLTQLTNGLVYAWGFLRDYGLFGAGLLLPAVFWRRLSAGEKAVWAFSLFFTAYVVLIGGDVLKVHRFFLPLLVPSTILLVIAVRIAVSGLRRRWTGPVAAVLVLGLLTLTYLMPRSQVEHYNFNERGLVLRMQFMAERLKEVDKTAFSVAVPTIGRFGYELVGHRIIDLLGLTDTTIARQSEPPIPGMKTTWKEQKHNSRYILNLAPDYILFSTGIKPSAPAERALLLYRQFTDSYRIIGWLRMNPLVPDATPLIEGIFRKTHPMTGEPVPYYPVEYVDEYKAGLEALNSGRTQEALAHFDRALQVSPQPYFVYLIYDKALALTFLNQYAVAAPMMDSLLLRDSTVFEAHMSLYALAAFQNDAAKAQVHQRWLLKLVPWLWPRIQARAAQMIEAERRSRPVPSK